jgi:hypothetical protein
LDNEISGIKLQVTYRITDSIEKDIETHKNDHDPKELWLAYMDLWNALGAAGLPEKEVIIQKEKYFIGIHFRGIEELIHDAETMKTVV